MLFAVGEITPLTASSFPPPVKAIRLCSTMLVHWWATTGYPNSLRTTLTTRFVSSSVRIPTEQAYMTAATGSPYVLSNESQLSSEMRECCFIKPVEKPRMLRVSYRMTRRSWREADKAAAMVEMAVVGYEPRACFERGRGFHVATNMYCVSA